MHTLRCLCMRYYGSRVFGIIIVAKRCLTRLASSMLYLDIHLHLARYFALGNTTLVQLT